MNEDFEFPALINAMSELAKRSLGTIIPVFFAIFALGFAVDYYFGDVAGANLVVGIATFIISYFLVIGLARHAGLLGETESGPGFGAYFGVSFVVGIGTALGFVLFVLPGIFLTIRWLLAFPALFSPRTYGEQGRGAIGQSWDMTGRVFWKLLAGWILGLLFIAINLYAYLTWAASFDQTTMLIGLAVANGAAAANSIYSLILGFAAFTLLQNDREELERIFA